MTKKEMRVALDAMILEVTCFREKLCELRAEMHNRAPKTRGKSTSEPLTDEKRVEIQTIHLKNPDLPQHEIAKQTNTNQGRISETLSGKRT